MTLMVEVSYVMGKIKIKANTQITDEYFLLELEAAELNDIIEPGQFLNIRLSNTENYDPLLRRPLSIHDINIEKNSVFLLYRLVGKGTKLLSKFKPGEYLDIIGPLGTGFMTDIENKDILIVGGGMGIAPLYYLSKELSIHNKLTIFLGGSKENDLKYFAEKFYKISNDIKLATIDGSMGYMGNVIELWESLEEYNYDYIYACGPIPMLVCVQELARNNNIKGQVSLEERMGCGIGLCLSCVCQTKDGNQRVCKEGPVFPLKKVNFYDNYNGCDCNE